MVTRARCQRCGGIVPPICSSSHSSYPICVGCIQQDATDTVNKAVKPLTKEEKEMNPIQCRNCKREFAYVSDKLMSYFPQMTCICFECQGRYEELLTKEEKEYFIQAGAAYADKIMNKSMGTNSKSDRIIRLEKEGIHGSLSRTLFHHKDRVKDYLEQVSPGHWQNCEEYIALIEQEINLMRETYAAYLNAKKELEE